MSAANTTSKPEVQTSFQRADKLVWSADSSGSAGFFSLLTFNSHVHTRQLGPSSPRAPMLHQNLQTGTATKTAGTNWDLCLGFKSDREKQSCAVSPPNTFLDRPSSSALPPPVGSVTGSSRRVSEPAQGPSLLTPSLHMFIGDICPPQLPITLSLGNLSEFSSLVGILEGVFGSSLGLWVEFSSSPACAGVGFLQTPHFPPTVLKRAR